MIPLIRPIFPSHEDAIEFFRRSLDTRQLSNFGPAHEAVSARLSELTCGHALPVISGTAALEIALRIHVKRPGARVLVPDFTHTGTILAVVRAGMVPVLAGVDEATWCLRPHEVADAFTKGKIDSAIVVNPFGYGVDTDTWEALGKCLHMPLVYDFAGAWGSTLSSSHPVCYSLHATKNLGIGEGGVLVFSRQEERLAARRLINFDTLPDRSIASLDGSNAKMDELRCAYLLAALEPRFRDRAADRAATKRILIRLYQRFLEGTSHAAISERSYPSLCVLAGLSPKALEDSDVEAQFKAYYPLLSTMPALAGVERLSVSDGMMATCCALPSDVTLQEAFDVIDLVKEICK